MSDAMEQLEALARAQLDLLRELGENIAGIRVRETAPDGTVNITVDGNGGLLDVELAVGISSLSPAQFERNVLDTAGAAARLAFAQRADLVNAFNQQAFDE
jgi:hypothetical protein